MQSYFHEQQKKDRSIRKTGFVSCEKLLEPTVETYRSGLEKGKKEPRFVSEEKKKKGKAEEAAEKTGEVVGKGLKKGFGVVKGFGSGVKKGVKGEDKKEKEK